MKKKILMVDPVPQIILNSPGGFDDRHEQMKKALEQMKGAYGIIGPDDKIELVHVSPAMRIAATIEMKPLPKFPTIIAPDAVESFKKMSEAFSKFHGHPTFTKLASALQIFRKVNYPLPHVSEGVKKLIIKKLDRDDLQKEKFRNKYL